MEQFKVLFVFMLTAAAVDGHFHHPGNCPNPSFQKDFNVTKYMGTWYEIERIAPEEGKCNQATYSLLPNGTVSFRHSLLLPTGKIGSLEGVATVDNSSQSAVLDISFINGGSPPRYWVVSTDYQSYALAYTCSEYNGIHFSFAWILSRTRELSVNIISKLHDELSAVGMNLKHLRVNDQRDCDAKMT